MYGTAIVRRLQCSGLVLMPIHLHDLFGVRQYISLSLPQRHFRYLSAYPLPIHLHLLLDRMLVVSCMQRKPKYYCSTQSAITNSLLLIANSNWVSLEDVSISELPVNSFKRLVDECNWRVIATEPSCPCPIIQLTTKLKQ